MDLSSSSSLSAPSSADASLSVRREIATKGFAKGDHYHRARPSYLPQLIDFILQEIHDSLHTNSADHDSSPSRPFFLEIGCGTGLFTSVLLSRLSSSFFSPLFPSYDYTATDLNESMLDSFRSIFPSTPAILTPASNLSFAKDNSVSAIIAAQCLHWCTDMKSLTELHRVLDDNGVMVAIWNAPLYSTYPYPNDPLFPSNAPNASTSSDVSPSTSTPYPAVLPSLDIHNKDIPPAWLLDIERFIDRYMVPAGAPQYKYMRWKSELDASGLFEIKRFLRVEKSLHHRLSHQDIVNRIFSLSVFSAMNKDEQKSVEQEILSILRVKHQLPADGLLDYQYKTDVYIFQKKNAQKS